VDKTKEARCKMKKSLLLSCLAILLGAAGIYFEICQSASWSSAKTDRRILPNLPLNDISKINLQSANAAVTLEKKNGTWSVADRNDYPADFQKIRDLTQKLWELKAVQEMQVGLSQFSRLKIGTPGQGDGSGTKIELLGDQNKELGSLIVGKSMEQGEQRGPGGRFIFNPATKDRVYLVSERFSEIDPLIVGLWLDPAFFQPDQLKEIDQKPWANNPGWKVSRGDDKAPWTLEGATKDEKLDPAFEGSLDSFSPVFQDVCPPSTSSDLTGLNAPFEAELKTFDGFSYSIILGKPGPGKARYFQVKVSADFPTTRSPSGDETPEAKRKNDEEFDRKIAALKERLKKEKRFEEWIYLVPDSTVESILKRRDEILAKPQG
jgi:Domain of unknown function (DUF4340)